jgi:hypothetical protein
MEAASITLAKSSADLAEAMKESAVTAAMGALIANSGLTTDQILERIALLKSVQKK